MSKLFVYAGTYQTTNWSSDVKPNWFIHRQPGLGIARARFDAVSGRFELMGYTPLEDNPSVLCVSPDKRFLYAGHETKNLGGVQGAGGGVSAFRIDPRTGDLTFINRVPSCGSFPCGVVCDRTGTYVLLANHASYFTTTSFVPTEDGDWRPHVHCDVGSVVLFKVRSDGGLEEACDVAELRCTGGDVINQLSPHPHGVAITADDLVIVPNKGGDSIELFRLDRRCDQLRRLETCAAEYNSAPRHVALHPTQRYAFVVNEFNNKIVSYRIDHEHMEEIEQVYNVPPQHVGKSYTAGDIQITPDGRFVYCTTSTYKSLCCYRFDEQRERLTLVGSFRENMDYFREFSITPDGGCLIAGDTTAGRLVAFRIDRESGRLQVVEHSTPAISPSCMRCVEFD